AAVVELSGPIDLTGELADGYDSKFQQVQLDYLGCTSYAQCSAAEAASPSYAVDPSDPPFFVGHSRGEFIPTEQAAVLRDALEEAGVAHEYVKAPGNLHSIALLSDELRAQIVEFLRAHL